MPRKTKKDTDKELKDDSVTNTKKSTKSTKKDTNKDTKKDTKKDVKKEVKKDVKNDVKKDIKNDVKKDTKSSTKSSTKIGTKNNKTDIKDDISYDSSDDTEYTNYSFSSDNYNDNEDNNENDENDENDDIKDGDNTQEGKLSKRKLIEREKELKLRQLPDVPASKKLRPNDIHRIVQHTDNSIFDNDKCCLWTGYITNLRNKRKGTYINFYFRDKKKVALHRLLYANFKGEIGNQDYIKYSCHNKGKCCNINHMVRFEYNAGDIDENDEDDDLSSFDSIDDDIKVVIF